MNNLPGAMIILGFFVMIFLSVLAGMKREKLMRDIKPPDAGFWDGIDLVDGDYTPPSLRPPLDKP